jgi:hypothetical protein
MNDIYEKSPLRLAKVCLQGPLLCLTHGHASRQCHMAASAPIYGIIECGILCFRLSGSLLFDGPRSISPKRPTHIAGRAIPSFNTLQRHGGPLGFQLMMMMMMETISLGYIDNPKTLASTAKWSFLRGHPGASQLVRVCSHLVSHVDEGWSSR